MKKLLDLVDENTLQELATPADFRLGKEIVLNGGVKFVKAGPYNAIAKVQPVGGQKRTVALAATKQGLSCKCT
jgi:hypothetical protein